MPKHKIYKIISLATIAFQLLSAFVVLFIIYLVFALLDMNDFDLPGNIGFLIFQPVFGIAVSGLTIIVCFILGLPIRLSSKLYNWWSKRPYIFFGVIAIGFILLIMSLLFTETINEVSNGQEVAKQIPNTTLAVTGWFLTAFSLLHFYPFIMFKCVNNIIRKNTGF